MLAEDRPVINTVSDAINGSPRRRFYNLRQNRVYELSVPEGRGRRCWGSREGWICTIGLDLEIHLLNPLTGSQIRLPPLSAVPDYEPDEDEDHPRWARNWLVSRLLGFRRESDGDFVVVAMFRSGFYPLGLARDASSWVLVDCGRYHCYDPEVADPNEPPAFCGFSDAAFHRGQLFVADCHGNLYLCDIDSHSPKITLFASSRSLEGVVEDKITDTHFEEVFLVSSGDELWLITSSRAVLDIDTDEERYITNHFGVYGLDLESRVWNKLEDIGDKAVFLGFNVSMCFSASEVELEGCKANHIYYTDTHRSVWSASYPGGRDMGIYNVADGSIHHLYTGDNCMSNVSPPFWFVPSLY